jgi:mRNA-degrading endonuclease RelE of RelBE toxin-antitoxin system
VTLLTKRADKDLKQLPGPFSEKARELIRKLEVEPALGKKLQGPLEGQRSARLGRSHRIIYTSRGADVVVLTIIARKDAYR